MSASPNATYRRSIPAEIADQLAGVDCRKHSIEIRQAELRAKAGLPYALILPATRPTGRALIADEAAYAAQRRWWRNAARHARQAQEEREYLRAFAYYGEAADEDSAS